LAWEDTFLFADRRGNWHIISYVYSCPDFREPVSGHAFSRNGINWSWTSVQPYTTVVENTDGTTSHFGTRERPKLLFKGGYAPRTLAEMVPTHLHSAVNAQCAGHDKTDIGTDWTFHHIQLLALKLDDV
jgi:hypothetical protein